LKENRRGSISGMVKPLTGQAKFSEKVMRSGSPFGRRGLQDGDAVGEVQRGAETVGQPRLQPLAHHDPVDHHVDVVAELLVERGRIVELVEFAIDLHPLEALLAQLGNSLRYSPLRSRTMGASR
jgi:hypothetical protein